MDVICLTIWEGQCRSTSRLWILIWNLAYVLEPSPQGVFLVVILRVLVGSQTGSFTLRFFSCASLIRLAHTVSKDFTLLLARVILVWWMVTSDSDRDLLVSLKAMAAERLPNQIVPWWESWVSQEQELTAWSTTAAVTVFPPKRLHSFLWLSNIPVYLNNPVYLSIWIILDMQMIPLSWQKVERKKRTSWWGWKRRVKKLA